MKKEIFQRKALKENAEKLNVLYVENHAGTRLRLGRLLRRYFNKVFVTTYADNAIKIFQSGHFDLIITSASLPDMKTTEICRKIKNIAFKKPIIIVSKNKNPDEIIELINMGIAGFITTPLEEKKIIPILSRVTLEISDLQLIYNFQDLMEQELDQELKFEEHHEERIEEDAFDDKEDNLLEESNIDLLITRYDPISAKEFIEDYPTELTLTADKLISINEGIDLHINKFINNPSYANAITVADEFKKFATVLSEIDELSNMTFSINKLSIIFETIDYTQNYKEYYDIILAVSDELMHWCYSIFIHQNVDDIHYLDKSFLADALMLESLFRRNLKKNHA